MSDIQVTWHLPNRGVVVAKVWFKRLSHCHTAICNSFWDKVGVGLRSMGRQREERKVWCSCPLTCVAQGGMWLPYGKFISGC